MRFSSITALCAAPLVLAGSLQADLVGRGVVNVETDLSVGSSSGKGNSNSKSDNSGKSGNDGNSLQITQSSSVDEVLIIWVNEGGGAATSTVTNTVTVTAGSGTSMSAATHSVCFMLDEITLC